MWSLLGLCSNLEMLQIPEGICTQRQGIPCSKQRNGEEVCIPLAGEDPSGVTWNQAGVLGAESLPTSAPSLLVQAHAQRVGPGQL